MRYPSFRMAKLQKKKRHTATTSLGIKPELWYQMRMFAFKQRMTATQAAEAAFRAYLIQNGENEVA